MKINVKALLSLLVCIMLLLSSSFQTFAEKGASKDKSRSFKDVPKGFWAYDDIMWMLDRNIIDGIGDDLFSPNSTVTRSQFAKMMVNTLNLQRYSPDTPSFLDVKKNSWEYSYVEAAKPYLTGFRTSSGDYFKPLQAAVREDMAVALVVALGYHNETVDESILNRFADADQINPNLRKHVALSVKHGLIEGTLQNNKTLFDPLGNLTRAQAAKLLYRAFKSYDEKITYDETKVTYASNTYIRPSVSILSDNRNLFVTWKKIDSPQLAGYKVVVSKNDSSPKYPDNGYLYYLTDKNTTSVIIDNRSTYNGNSDFGQYLVKGHKYYFSVTAVYSDRNVAGNAVRYVYPGNGDEVLYPAPAVYTTIENGNLVVRWNRIASENLKEYRVVISKNNTTPKYPQDGYLYNITDKERTYAVINNSTKYNNGDFGSYLIKGEKYYFSVTAVYKDRNVTGNTLQCLYNGEDNPALFPAPVVSAAYNNDGNLVVEWNKIGSPQLTEYRLVISQNNKIPIYPANGFYNIPYDKSTTSAAVEISKPYMNGDFSALKDGAEYYFSVTAVYNGNKYIAGNAVKVLYLLPPKRQ